MKYLALASLLINAAFVHWLFLAPIGMAERDYRHTADITWERDPAFVASMTAMVDDSKYTNVHALYLGGYKTIVANVPSNRFEMITLGHETLHAFNYGHK